MVTPHAVQNTIVVHHFEPASLLSVLQELEQLDIHLADAAIVVLAQTVNFSRPVLTDDLALRQYLEAYRNWVIGSVGLDSGVSHSID